MNTFSTLAAARQYARTKPAAVRILEIDHKTAGRCYIAVATTLDGFQRAIDRKPVAEVIRLVAEHHIKTDVERAEEEAAAKAQVAHDLKHNTRCDRCRAPVDGTACYAQIEWYLGSKVTAYYCDACRTLLGAIGAGEHTALQERAAERPSMDPETKPDF